MALEWRGEAAIGRLMDSCVGARRAAELHVHCK